MELAITELFWPQRHGITKSTTQNIQGHFLVYNTLQPDELYDGSYKDIVDGLLEEQRECMFKFSCGLGGLLPDDITKCILEEYREWINDGLNKHIILLLREDPII